MKPYFAILAGLVVAAPLARAQVTINQAALDQLAGIPPVVVTAPPMVAPPVHRVSYRPLIHHHVTPAPQTLATVAPAEKAPIVPKPATPDVTPAAVRPVAPKLPPPAPPPSAAVTFASGASNLPPGLVAQIQPFCIKPAGSGQITIDAYAAADPSDPSAAPRLSMARAFALRDALVACGVPSSSIIPRANGVGKHPDIAQISVAP